MTRLPSQWLGRVRRKVLWPILGPDEFPELRLIDEKSRNRFVALIKAGEILDESADPTRIALRTLTTDEYLRYARICYEGAFDLSRWLSDPELYRAFADGRSAGLLDVRPGDPDAFAIWYRTEAFSGAHPFEIVRDQTVLFVHQLPCPPRCFFLRLANRRRDRVEPYLIRMALALHAGSVPFLMENACAHAHFVRGDDWIAVTEDAAWDRGCPRIPASVELLNAPQNLVLTSQLESAPEVLDQVEWLNAPLEYEYEPERSSESSTS